MNIYQKAGAVAVTLVVTYLVALALFALTLVAIETYARHQYEMGAGLRCLVWGSKP